MKTLEKIHGGTYVKKDDNVAMHALIVSLEQTDEKFAELKKWAIAYRVVEPKGNKRAKAAI